MLASYNTLTDPAPIVRQPKAPTHSNKMLLTKITEGQPHPPSAMVPSAKHLNPFLGHLLPTSELGAERIEEDSDMCRKDAGGEGAAF